MSTKDQFLSRWGFLAAAIGMAIGTGNIWRFPRMAAQYGGGAFILAYTLALFLWSAPLLMSEMAIGRKTRRGPIGGFRDFLDRRCTWMGAWMATVCMLITFYYSVVTGYCLKYFVLAMQGAFKEGVDTTALWNDFLSKPFETVLFHALAIGLCGLVIYRGIQSGVEKVAKLMVPALFIFLVVAAARAVTLTGAGEGLRYLFVPDWSKLGQPATWLQAFTQSAWSTGAGWGLLLTYAIYTTKKEDISQNCLLVGFGDQSVALLAGMAIIPTIFALSPSLEQANAAMASGNTGLTFISLAQLIPKMAGGVIIAPVFFLALVFAAFTSLIAMVEVGVRSFIDAGWGRKKSAVAVVAGCFLLGLPSAFFPSFLENQDWVWGVALLLSGFFVILAVWKYGAEKVRTELINPSADIKMGRWWSFIIKFVSPVVFLVLTCWWFYRGIVDNPKNWWKPFGTFTTMTVLFQWAILLVVLLAATRLLARWVKASPPEVD